jgi:hypothetical protein
MNRSQATTWLQREIGPLLTEVGIEPAVLDHAVDDALLLSGVAYGDLGSATVADADTFGFQVILRYTGLRWVYSRSLAKVDVSVSDPNVSKSRSQFVAHLKDALADARDAAAEYIAEGGAFSVGAIVFGDRPVPPGTEFASIW